MYRKDDKSYEYGDYRVVEEFAWFSTRVRDYSGNTDGTLWLEKYDSVQKYYVGVGWHEEYCAVRGTGIIKARFLAKLYDGKIIE